MGWCIRTAVTGQHRKRNFLYGALVTNFSDLDVFLWGVFFSNPIDAHFFHRWITHSLLFLLIVSVIAWVTHRRYDQSCVLRRYILAYFLSMSLWHLLLDAFTSYGVRVWLPRESITQSFDLLFIIDLLFWAILIVIAVSWLATCVQKRRLVAYGWLVIVVAYIGFAGFQKATNLHWACDYLAQNHPWSSQIVSIPTAFQPFMRRTVAKSPTEIIELTKSNLGTWYQVTVSTTTTLPEQELRKKILASPHAQQLSRHYDAIIWSTRWYYSISMSWADYLIENYIFDKLPGQPHRMFSYLFATQQGEFMMVRPSYEGNIDDLFQTLRHQVQGRFWEIQ